MGHLQQAATVVALTLALAATGACSDDTPDADDTPRLPKSEFCERWTEIGVMQTDGNSAAAAMELARISLEAPQDVAEPVDTLYRLLEQQIAGEEPDVAVMLDASLEIGDYCES